MVLVILYALFTNNAITTATQFVHSTTPQAYDDIDHVLRKNLKGPNPIHHNSLQPNNVYHITRIVPSGPNPFQQL